MKTKGLIKLDVNVRKSPGSVSYSFTTQIYSLRYVLVYNISKHLVKDWGIYDSAIVSKFLYIISRRQVFLEKL